MGLGWVQVVEEDDDDDDEEEEEEKEEEEEVAMLLLGFGRAPCKIHCGETMGSPSSNASINFSVVQREDIIR